MAKAHQIIITFEPESGSVQIHGPIGHPFWMAGALMEALRVVQKRANEAEAQKRNGGLVVADASALPPGH